MVMFMTNMTNQQPLEYAKMRWIEALRNGTDYDAVYWQGFIDGLKAKMEKTEYRHVMEEITRAKMEEYAK